MNAVLSRASDALSAESQLLVLLNLARVSEAETSRILALSSKVSWPEVFRLAELNAVLPLSLTQLERAGAWSSVPAEIAEQWRQKAEAIRAKGRARLPHASGLLSAFAQAGIPTIVLKGSLFADEIYADPTYKKMNDVDLMVPFARAADAAGILRSLSFSSVGQLLGKKEIDPQSHHSPPFVSQDIRCVVGLHWGIVSQHSPYRPITDALWRRAKKATAAGVPCLRLSWEDCLLHLCIHLPFFKIGLRELADVANVIAFASTPLDWKALELRAREWKAQDAVYRVLSLTSALYALNLPEGLLERLEAEATHFTREDTRLRLADPDRILRSRSTQVSKIEKAYAVFKLSPMYRERALAYGAMWKFLLWPKSAEVGKIASEEKPRGPVAIARARLETPAKLWQAMAKEHGSKALTLMTAANALSLAKATARRPFTRDGESLMKHPAASLLEALE